MAKRTATTIYFEDDKEHEEIKEAAKKDRRSVSSYMVSASLEKARKEGR